MLASQLLKEISRVSPGFRMALIATLGSGMAILQRGRPETIERCALPVLRFEKIGASALTEPEPGSDAIGGMRTTAVPEGDALVLNGRKTFISNAPYADVFVVYARVAARPGLPLRERPVRAIVLGRGTPGLETGPPLRKMGVHDSPTGEVFLRDCRAPPEHLLGSLEPRSRAGSSGPDETLHLERAVMPAMGLGIIERCVEQSARYARERRQFGRPIGAFQGVAFKLARMEVALESAGYIAELPLEKLMRDAKVFEIGGGTNEIQLRTIARALLESDPQG